MPRKGHSEEQIIRALREAEGGKKAADICRELGVSQQAFYAWKRRYGRAGIERAARVRADGNYPVDEPLPQPPRSAGGVETAPAGLGCQPRALRVPATDDSIAAGGPARQRQADLPAVRRSGVAVAD